MNNVAFTYPTKTKPTIMDVSLTVSQVSRVAVIGANGAGNPLPSICLLGNSCQQKGASGRPRACGWHA